MSNAKLIKALEAVKVDDYCAEWDWRNDAPHPTTSPTFHVEDGTVVVSAESGDGAGDYYGEYQDGCPHIDPKIEKIAEDNGFYCEWHNAGCFGIYPI